MFGNLTIKTKKEYNIKKILNNNTMEINYLFNNPEKSLEKLTIIEAERQIALEHLRDLTNELQTKRLRYKSKAVCKYFTL